MTTIFGRPTGLFFSYDAIFERHDISTLEKLIYIYFCRRANSDGESTPAYDTIAKDCGCHRNSAIGAVKKLSNFGLVVKHKRKRQNGSDTSNLYIIFPPNEPFDEGKESISDNGKVIPKKANKIGGLFQTTPRVAQGNPRGVVSDNPQKETHNKDHVVEPPPVVNNVNIKNKSSSVINDGATFNSVEKFRERVYAIASVQIPTNFAREIVARYPPERVTAALVELDRQLSRGIKIRGVGAWLRYALKNDIKPDQLAKTIQKKGGNNNRSPRARPRETGYQMTPEQREKKKEFIRSLYT